MVAAKKLTLGGTPSDVEQARVQRELRGGEVWPEFPAELAGVRGGVAPNWNSPEAERVGRERRKIEEMLVFNQAWSLAGLNHPSTRIQGD